MHSTIMDPTVDTFAGFIVEPTDVLTMDILIPPEDILVHPISGDGTNAIGTRQAQKVERSVPAAC